MLPVQETASYTATDTRAFGGVADVAVVLYRRVSTGTLGAATVHLSGPIPNVFKDNFGEGYQAHFVMLSGLSGEDEWQKLLAIARNNPWAGRIPFRDNLGVWAEHFPRPPKESPDMLAYYASPEHRVAGRLTRTRPGRYLRKFFGHMLDDRQIEELAHVWLREFSLRDLKITQDADEIEEVYVNGPRSCMSKSASHFDGPCHPARVYAGPDLAVAYIGDMDDAEGRAVVWPGKKLYARTYGDEARLIASLEAAGFTRGSDCDFEGARLRHIPHTYGVGFVLPYVDMSDTVDLAGDYVVLANTGGEYEALETNGLCAGAGAICAHCEDRMNPDDSYYVEELGGICEHCYCNHFFYCEETDQTWANSDRANTRCGTHISERGARRSDRWYYCEGTEEWVDSHDDDYVILSDGRTVSMQWADGNAFLDDVNDEWHEIEYLCNTGDKHRWVRNWVPLSNGEAVNRGDFKSAFKMAAWIYDRDSDARAEYETCDRDELNALLDLWAEEDATAEEAEETTSEAA